MTQDKQKESQRGVWVPVRVKRVAQDGRKKGKEGAVQCTGVDYVHLLFIHQHELYHFSLLVGQHCLRPTLRHCLFLTFAGLRCLGAIFSLGVLAKCLSLASCEQLSLALFFTFFPILGNIFRTIICLVCGTFWEG